MNQTSSRILVHDASLVFKMHAVGMIYHAQYIHAHANQLVYLFSIMLVNYILPLTKYAIQFLNINPIK